MSVLLICPNFAEIYSAYRHLYKRGFLNPPMGLCYLASSLLLNGHDAKIIDAEAENLTLGQVSEIATRYNPSLIGITATSVDVERGERLAKSLKAIMPNIPILIGGVHVNIFRKQVLEGCPYFDYACLGDGEDLIVELIEAIKNNSTKDDIKGLIYRENGEIVENEMRTIEKNISRYSMPARHLLKNELYYRSVPYKGYITTAAVMSSRGCPYNCIFCAVKNIYGGSKVRINTSENVLEELEFIVKEMNIRHISFNDDNLTINRNRMMEICDGIHECKLSFTWEGLSRADLLDEELLRNMKSAGLVRMSIGIESGNPTILKVLNKNESLEQIEESINLCKKVGIVTRGSVIIGSPYETRHTIKDTFKFIKKLKALDQVVINILQPYPGTKVRDMIFKGEGGTRFVGDQISSGSLRRFGNSSVMVNDLTPQKLIFLQKYGFFKFFLRPRVILNNIRISGLKTFTIDSFGFIRSILGI